jgi:putative transcriptional regulator
MSLRLAPGFLIAMPQLGDENFVRSVVLMLHHDADGAMGLVVNRRTEIRLGQFCAEHDLPYGGGDEAYLHFGGPCELQRGFLIHQDREVSTHHLEIAPGLFFSTDVSSVKAVLQQGRGQFRFLLGYAGWGPGQLEREMAEGAWLSSEVRADRVFEQDANAIWALSLGDLGIDPAQLQWSTERH